MAVPLASRSRQSPWKGHAPANGSAWWSRATRCRAAAEWPRATRPWCPAGTRAPSRSAAAGSRRKGKRQLGTTLQSPPATPAHGSAELGCRRAGATAPQRRNCWSTAPWHDAVTAGACAAIGAEARAVNRSAREARWPWEIRTAQYPTALLGRGGQPQERLGPVGPRGEPPTPPSACRAPRAACQRVSRATPTVWPRAAARIRAVRPARAAPPRPSC